MNNQYYALVPDPGAYLARIGLNPDDYRKSLHPELPDSPSDYSAPHTKQALDTLVKAHLYHVPFEALDAYDLQREVSLTIEDLYQKIVVRRRGGYCFELNGLLFALAESLGFTCIPVACRVLFEGDLPTVGHRNNIAILDDGKRVTFDVGFGGPAPISTLYLDCDQPQTSGKLTFRIDRSGHNGAFRQVLINPDGSESPLLMFTDQRFEQVDFVALSAYMTLHSTARFRNERVLNLLREEGSVAISNNTLRIHENGKLTEIELKTPEERKRAYTEYFGIPAESLTEF